MSITDDCDREVVVVLLSSSSSLSAVLLRRLFIVGDSEKGDGLGRIYSERA